MNASASHQTSGVARNHARDGARSAAVACTVAIAVALSVCMGIAHAQTNPYAPGAIVLPELGRLNGTLKCVTAMDESFGRQIYPIGDVNGDSLNDWVLTHRRCDTSFSGRAVIELLLYHGVRGGLPPTGAGMRIGPSEINADCSFIGAGDYDGDGHRDLAISQSIMWDPYNRGLLISSVVIYWNDGAGRFVVTDTTHLTASNERISIMWQADYELWARGPLNCDIDRDGAEDLVVLTNGRHYVDTVRSPFPSVVIYRGHRGARWGRGSVAARPDWQLWQRLFTRRVSVLDHDGDGALDIAMYVDEDIIGKRGGMTVLYGRPGMLPDTTFERIDFVRVDGHDGMQGQLIDLTGDRVPELIVSTGDTPNGASWRWLIYVGRRGQRLLEQYGTGNDPPRPGDKLWWGRPWTQVWTPRHFDLNWNNPPLAILEPGDLGLDGVDDFCAASFPRIICYNGGSRLDSWIDAEMKVWPADYNDARIVRLGDIDGSGRPTIGAPFDGGGVRFYTTSRDVPRDGVVIRLPEGTDRPVSVPVPADAASSIALTITPNPASTLAHVRWSGGPGAARVSLLDLHGRELRRWSLPRELGGLAIDLAGMPDGAYLVTVTAGGAAATSPLIHVE